MNISKCSLKLPNGAFASSFAANKKHGRCPSLSSVSLLIVGLFAYFAIFLKGEIRKNTDSITEE